jgi:cobalt/nickel transport system permease protein
MRHLYSSTAHTSHLLTGLDPRVKLLTALAMLLMVVSHRGVAFPLLAAGLGVGICLTIGVRPRLLLVRFAEPLLLAAMVLVLKALFSGSETIWSGSALGLEFALHRDGLLEGVRIAGRIAGAVAVVAAVGFATPFTELLAALAWLRVPHGLIEVTIFAWRYLFVLADDAQVIHAAQKNRLGYVGVRRGIRSFGTLAGALVIKAFDSSQAMTVAMVQRGYDGRLPLLQHRPFRSAEVVPAALVVTLMGALWRI